MADVNRCHGCNLTVEESWWVMAELDSCPTCEDRDRIIEGLRDQKSTAGLKTTFTALTTLDESQQVSSAARLTRAGAEQRHRLRQGRTV